MERLRQFEDGWSDQMIEIWREKLEQLGIIDTGALYRSLTGKVSRADVTTIEHRFLEYGIYVERGVGREMGGERDSAGHLLSLDAVRRIDRGMGEPRKRKPWFARKYIASIMKLGEVERDAFGDEYLGQVSNVLSEIFEDKGLLRNL